MTKEVHSTPIEYVSTKNGAVSKAAFAELQGEVQGEVFSNEPKLPHNKLNHLKNLHGAPGVEGLTGRWHGTVFERGVPRKKR